MGYSQQRIIRYILGLLGIPLPLPPETKLSKSTLNQQLVFERPTYGVGLEGMDPNDWRAFLFSNRSPEEMLEEVRDTLMMDIKPQDLTLLQVVEGVRRCTGIQHWKRAVESDRYWSEAQCRKVAEALCAEVSCELKYTTWKMPPTLSLS